MQQVVGLLATIDRLDQSLHFKHLHRYRLGDLRRDQVQVQDQLGGVAEEELVGRTFVPVDQADEPVARELLNGGELNSQLMGLKYTLMMIVSTRGAIIFKK